MMLDIVPLVRQMAPGLLGEGRASVACICTTRPKYLVFDANNPEIPACVVEYGDPARLTRTERILTELSTQMPGTVPAVICCTPWRNAQYVLIQQGLHGTPWFRVADTVRTEADWRSLLARAVGVMVRLHDAVRTVPEWKSRVSVGIELRRQAATARRSGVPVSPAVWQRVHDWAGAAGDRPVPSSWQHGDFSLNNLLVRPDGMAIIDFDEFGSTMVPLHDAFGLALSFTLSQNGASPLSRRDGVRECIARVTAAEPVDLAQLPALLLHHLLLRINQCAGLHTRTTLRRILLQWTDELARTPERFLS